MRCARKGLHPVYGRSGTKKTQPVSYTHLGAGIGGTVVNFNVTITGSNAEEVRQGVLDAEEEFERRMDAYFAKKARVSFA